MFFLKMGPTFSRAWLGLWYVTGIVSLVAFRAFVAAVTRRATRLPASETQSAPSGARARAAGNRNFAAGPVPSARPSAPPASSVTCPSRRRQIRWFPVSAM